MSKRGKGSAAQRPSKRHKPNDYAHNDGKTELQREMEYLQEHEAAQEQEEIYQAQQELQQSQQLSTDQYSSSQQNNIQLGDTPLSDEDDDHDLDDEDYHEPSYSQTQQASRIRDGDSDSEHHDSAPQNDDQYQSTAGGNDYSSNSHRMHQYDEDERDDNDRREHVQEITLKDMRDVQMKRDQLEKICTEPYFAKFVGRTYVQDPASTDPHEGFEIPGFFCRVFVGERRTSTGGTAPVYKIGEIVKVQPYPRPYSLMTKKTTVSVGLLLAHGKNERLFKVIQASNSPFTQQEFDQWKEQLRREGERLPSKDDLTDKYMSAIKMHRTFKYDDAQIAILKKRKDENFNAKTLPNPHKEKLRVAAVISGLLVDDPKRHKYEIYLNDINKEIERRNSVSSQQNKISIMAINERNKLKNKQLMLKAREKERRAALKMKGKKQAKDPFTRAITAPQIESFNNLLIDEEEANRKKEEEAKKKKEEEEKAKKLSKLKKEEHDLKNLSILEVHKKRMKRKREGSLADDDAFGDGEDAAWGKEQGLLIGNDALWKATVHSIAKDYVTKCRDIMGGCEYDDGLEMMLKQPQFGRNTNKSKYANRFTKRPSDLTIYSIDEYLQNFKYKKQ